MTEKTVTRFMYALIIVGLSISAFGVGLVIFTDIVTGQGVNGIATVAGLIAGGLFLSIPAKIYLTLQLMKRNDEKVRERRERGEIR
ncbi:MAG TPA: hypothetical protein PLE99_00220 [Candidatus Thiothrix moscowensis]|uniref:hypothetical protein n=1 Tax=unclassified Thiothrix TaxID=2636184 RepID=UPI001A1BE07A|nr:MULTISPECIES: hypothetical protein [unclassified Thiothrix]MBJ6610778.1 hypothetical protein [Candidatus Thiothrix moscowensis]HRJ51162.1 hypothetical protein [Candidatus Thiothrix moscowensis]HRJ91783.1 hypothetical protein [Candidatus Thiothrix moscowensis]